MSDPISASDPMEFMRNMWGQLGFSLPGMVAPTLDVDELEKRIKDLKAVEGWLRMNLSMLQLTIQGLEMQHSTLGAVRAMGTMAKANTPQSTGENGAGGEAAQAFTAAATQAALWPLNLMSQMQAQVQDHLEQHFANEPAPAEPAAAKPAQAASAKKAAPRKPAAKAGSKSGGGKAG
ncbi:PhaM family polyhydroxyalkanoate granule multifunctional regulatory protein [Oryzomicrobium sp.]|uniref:PhaM family polyhydroxyalkanoate granule multifunctional regulatory protein n=1 Tax=Oryzomicrobium sp. TaxID=1911578 RepID=UPI0025EBFD1E|nr:PhaM family polyhydroxyalkanoate granule multifunctional regulatory protein [Oryzomicrobium sp.]MCE1243136.1 hypothetical protein [Oryzomicrobium sp.]